MALRRPPSLIVKHPSLPFSQSISISNFPKLTHHRQNPNLHHYHYRHYPHHSSSSSSSFLPSALPFSYHCISTTPTSLSFIAKSYPGEIVPQGTGKSQPQRDDPATKFKNGWRIVASVVLERTPIITQELDPIEVKFNTARMLHMNQNSRPITKEWFPQTVSSQDNTKLSVQEEQAFVPAPRTTKHDQDNNMKSIHRKLDRKLYLAITKTENSKKMQFPQKQVDASESFRESNEKILRATIGLDSKVFFVGQAPSAHLELIYPTEYQEKNQVYGAKVFFFRAQLLSGDITTLKNAHDYKWLTKEELQTYLAKEYYNACQYLLF